MKTRCSAALSVDGASGGENMYYIDGVDTTNSSTATAPRTSTFDFVDEVQVKASGYQAEFGGSLGGVINVVSRSGGNEFHGEVIGYYSGSALRGTESRHPRLNQIDTPATRLLSLR